MDYNYVRMRNAVRDGDDALAESYRRLYEEGVKTKSESPVFNYIIALLAAVAAALFIYIIYLNAVQPAVSAPAEDSGIAEAMTENCMYVREV